jgi:hypothetical protein
MAPIKEPHYFSGIDIDEKIDKGYIYEWEDYLSLFKKVKGQKAIGEASVSYLCYEETALNIKKSIPHAKIIIILRNPIERVFSHFLMDIREGKLPPDSVFLETIKRDFYTSGKRGWGYTNLFIECGMYYQQVKFYLDIFGLKSVYVCFFDDLMLDTTFFVKNIFSFLNIEESFKPKSKVRKNRFAKPRNRLLRAIYTNTEFRKMGKKVIPDYMKEYIVNVFLKKVVKPKLTDQEKVFLIDIYKSDIQKLEKLLNKDLSDWYEL